MEKTIKMRWFDQYWKMTFNDDIWKMPKAERIKLFREEYHAHKYRIGELYDKYLDKMLYKYDLEYEDYYGMD